MELISRQAGRMTAEEAIATLKANYPDACYEQLREAVDTAIEALGKDINVPSKSALDHIHNVVMDDAYRRGYRDGKDTNVPTWIPVSERLPACEQEVLICTKVKLVGKDAYIDSIITPAFYEDGTMTENDSAWRWEEVDWAGWDEEEDCGIIPEGWWENRHFNPDDLLNCPVDREVVAWMPLPQPYKEG